MRINPKRLKKMSNSEILEELLKRERSARRSLPIIKKRYLEVLGDKNAKFFSPKNAAIAVKWLNGPWNPKKPKYKVRRKRRVNK